MDFPYEIGQEVFLITYDNRVRKCAIRGIEYTKDGGLWLIFYDDKCRSYAAYKTFEEAVQVLRDNEERRHEAVLEKIEWTASEGPIPEKITTPF